MPRSLFPTVLCSCLLTAAALAAPPSARIAIHSVASGHYAPPPPGSSDVSLHTFTIVDGGHAEGTYRDGKLAKLDFQAIADPLTAALERQGYRSAAAGEAPLIHLVVEWGRTNPIIDLSIDFSADRIGQLRSQPNEIPMTGTFNPQTQSRQNEIQGEQLKIRSAAERRNRTAWDNAQLLGYDDALYALTQLPRSQRPWKDQEELMTDLTSERLYLIVRAFIFDQVEPEEAPQARLMWLTRLSIRDEGPDFPTQLAILLPFAERYFGKSTGELIRATSLQDFKNRAPD